MLIRKATEKDFEQYYKLQIEFMDYINQISPELTAKPNKNKLKLNYLKDLKNKNELILILEENNIIIGFIDGGIQKIHNSGWIHKFNKVGYISDVFIQKEYRKKGYFKKALKHLLNFFKKKGIIYCNLHVNIENKAAIQAYEKNGFKILNYKMWKKIK